MDTDYPCIRLDYTKIMNSSFLTRKFESGTPEMVFMVF